MFIRLLLKNRQLDKYSIIYSLSSRKNREDELIHIISELENRKSEFQKTKVNELLSEYQDNSVDITSLHPEIKRGYFKCLAHKQDGWKYFLSILVSFKWWENWLSDSRGNLYLRIRGAFLSNMTTEDKYLDNGNYLPKVYMA